MPRRVVLLTRDASLAVAVKALLGDDDRVTELESPQELPPMGDLPVDAVVVDLPGSSRAATLERIRGRFKGPLVVLLGHGEDPTKARGVYRCSVLARPFGMSQLWSLLVGSATEAVTEVIPAIQRRDPSQRPAPAAERPAPEPGRPGDGAERRERPAADRPDRPVPSAEQPKRSAEPEPDRPARMADQPELAPERQAGPQPPPGERPQRPAVPPGARPSGGPPQAPASSPPPPPPRAAATPPPTARPSGGAPHPEPAQPPAPAPATPPPATPRAPAQPSLGEPPAAAAAAAAAEQSPGLLRNRPAPAPPPDADRPERSPGPIGERPGADVTHGRGDRPARPVEGRPERAPSSSARRVEPPAQPPIPPAGSEPPRERQAPPQPPPAAVAGAGRAPERQAAAQPPPPAVAQPPPGAARPERVPDRPAPRPEVAPEGGPNAVRERPAADRREEAGAKPVPKEARKPPPWNWRSRRFKRPPPEPVDPGALTQPMPRVQQANGVPPAPERPAQPPANGGAPVAQPRAPAQREDRQDRAPAVERREAPPAPDRQAPVPEPAPAVDRGERAAPEPQPAAPAAGRRDQPSPVDRRGAPPTGPAVDPRPAVPPLPPAPKVDRRDTGPSPEPRRTEPVAERPEPAAERREPAATVDPLVRNAGAPPSQAPASEPSRPDELLHDPPEAVADRLAERLGADTVALLLDNNRGLLEVAGGVGLTPAERRLQVEYGHEVLLELFRVGVGLIEDTERVRGLIRGIPGCNSQSLVMVPLVHEGHGFGALIIGRSSPPGQPRPEFTEPEIEALMDFAEDVAAPLRSTVLLRRLKGQFNTPNRP